MTQEDMAESGVVEPRFQALVDNVDIFHGLRSVDVQKIFARVMTMYIEQGDTIFHKNTEGNKMYVVLGGSIGVFDGGCLVHGRFT